MSPTNKDGTPIDYERRAHRMIARWAGVRGPVKSDEERNNVTEFFTDRNTGNTVQKEDLFILGKF